MGREGDPGEVGDELPYSELCGLARRLQAAPAGLARLGPTRYGESCLEAVAEGAAVGEVAAANRPTAVAGRLTHSADLEVEEWGKLEGAGLVVGREEAADAAAARAEAAFDGGSLGDRNESHAGGGGAVDRDTERCEKGLEVVGAVVGLEELSTAYACCEAAAKPWEPAFAAPAAL